MDNPILPKNTARLTWGDLPFLIPLPTVHDGLEATARKMQAIATIVGAGGRLELNTWPHSIIVRHDAEARAKQTMTDSELTAFDDWQYGNVPLPAFDWTCTESVRKDCFRRFQERAAAMDVIWERKGATPENAVWLSMRMQDIIPLVRAVEKVIKAQQYLALKDPFKGLDADQISEIETLRFIYFTASQSAKRERTRANNMADSINQSQAVLKARLAAIGGV
jgi:hypothetical protein